MIKKLLAAFKAVPTVVVLSAMIGCNSSDQGLAEFARQANERQARQNERMAQQFDSVAKQTHEVAATSKSLVEQDAAARRELIQAHENLQRQNYNERVEIDQKRQELDADRKAAANAAVRDPVIARGIVTAGLALAALLPLLVTVYALKRIPEQLPTDSLIIGNLVEDLLIGPPKPACKQPQSDLPPAAAPSLIGQSNDTTTGAAPLSDSSTTSK